jgi:hypothetical protein
VQIVNEQYGRTGIEHLWDEIYEGGKETLSLSFFAVLAVALGFSQLRKDVGKVVDLFGIQTLKDLDALIG